MPNQSFGRRSALVVMLPAVLTLFCPVLMAAQERANVRSQVRREVAVTFDDLPVVTRVFHDVAAQERITAALLASIQRQKVPAIGFVNEGKLRPGGSVDERRVALLQRWVESGLELGNHTYSHLGLHSTPLEAYLQDIARGDSVTAGLLLPTGRRPRYFRHPFLHSGRDLDTRRSVERFLAQRGYQVAPVTIDNSDYVFAAAYERAVARGDGDERRLIAAAYLDYMERVFAYYEQQSVALFGRELRQVLLLHANALNADHFDALADMMTRRGYRFVPLDYALADSAYRSEDRYTGPAGITWLHRWALTQGKRGAFFAGEPTVPEAIAKAAAISGAR
jgi:peptidoglycan/xylan/chitin deacetylase (PgdA/CDA1 family)